MIRRTGATLAMIVTWAILSGCATGKISRPPAVGENQLRERAVVAPPNRSSGDLTNQPTSIASSAAQVGQTPAVHWASLRLQSVKARVIERSKLRAAYDKELISRVNKRWDGLICAASPPAPTNGAVSVDFRLLPDGHVSDLRVINTTVDDRFTTVCKQAIFQSAPFEPYPKALWGSGPSTNGSRMIHFDFKFQ
ncbi:MAG: hypothetical protein ACXWJB_10645 [Limisphaerales bacterium]